MSKTIENLTAVETKAVAALVSDTVAREAAATIPVGTHPVDVTVRLTGTLTKGEDYDGQIVAKADPWTLLAVALSHLNGVTVESITREALAADPALVADLKKGAQAAIEAVKGLTVTRCNGKVTVKVTGVRV
jgi:hypothetical protein